MKLDGPTTADAFRDEFLNNTSPDEIPAILAQADMIFAAMTPQQIMQTEMLDEARGWWELEHRAPTLSVRCSALRRGKPCRATLAHIYASPDGPYIRYQYMPIVDATVQTLAAAQQFAAHGADWFSKRYTQIAGERRLTDDLLEHLDPGLEGGILIGCTDHGNVPVPASLLIEQATSKRRTLNLDCKRKFVR